MVNSKDPWHSHLHVLPSVWQWSCHYLLYDWGPSRHGFEHPITFVHDFLSFKSWFCKDRCVWELQMHVKTWYNAALHVRKRYVSRCLFIHVHVYMIFTAISHKFFHKDSSSHEKLEFLIINFYRLAKITKEYVRYLSKNNFTALQKWNDMKIRNHQATLIAVYTLKILILGTISRNVRLQTISFST